MLWTSYTLLLTNFIISADILSKILVHLVFSQYFCISFIDDQ